MTSTPGPKLSVKVPCRELVASSPDDADKQLGEAGPSELLNALCLCHMSEASGECLPSAFRAADRSAVVEYLGPEQALWMREKLFET